MFCAEYNKNGVRQSTNPSHEQDLGGRQCVWLLVQSMKVPALRQQAPQRPGSVDETLGWRPSVRAETAKSSDSGSKSMSRPPSFHLRDDSNVMSTAACDQLTFTLAPSRNDAMMRDSENSWSGMLSAEFTRRSSYHSLTPRDNRDPTMMSRISRRHIEIGEGDAPLKMREPSIVQSAARVSWACPMAGAPRSVRHLRSRSP